RLTGTAAAAAYVSGACALFYQYTIVDDRYPYEGFTPNMKAFFIRFTFFRKNPSSIQAMFNSEIK
ncbi:hypothetical protein, partial [Terrisporobacter muris]